MVIAVPAVPRTALLPLSTYVKQLRAELPPKVFEPARSRLLMIPAHLAVIAVCVWLVAAVAPWFLVPLLSVVIGVSFAVLTFIGHETLHGGIVRGRRLKLAIGWLGFLPFAVSPRLWTAWHGRVHHSNANRDDDPDGYPTLAEYRASGRVRFFIRAFALGGRRLRGLLSLVLGFTIQSVHQLVAARRYGHLSARAHRAAIAETLAGVAFWVAVAFLVGGGTFIWIFVVPHLVANVVVMSFIMTNHSLSPRVEINDPLVSGLSVTSWRWFELLTLQFGYHVEHHVFPAMSSRHAPQVRTLLLKLWPERYQSMPLGHALASLFRSARVYKDAVTLVDPLTQREYATLAPRPST